MSGKQDNFLKSFDGAEIFYRLWDKVEKPKGVFMIIHGMVEHTGRYEDFAKFLNKNGYIVFAWDLRAHGKTAGEPNKVGKYAGDLFADCVEDAIFFADMLLKKYKLPLIVFGHSYGSFVLQSFIQQYNEHSMAIFSGSANMKKSGSVGMGLIVAKMSRFFMGKDAPAHMIYKMSFQEYGKDFPKGNWLTRDDEIWTKYNNDPFCGNVCSTNFYCSMFENLKRLYIPENLQNIDKNIPLLIVSGALDPVGKQGLLPTQLKKLYDGQGVKEVQLNLFKDCRHEILNETNKAEIWKYIVDFCNSHISKKPTKKATPKKKSQSKK